MSLQADTAQALMWKMLERGGYLGCQFVIQIVMARLLSPSDYGVLSIMVVFTSLANVFVQTGLTTSLIQVKSIDRETMSSVYWFNFFVSILLTVLLFFAAPFIETYYRFENFMFPFRVLLLILPLSANAAVQVALFTRNMTIKPIFRASLVSVIVSGVSGIFLAYKGFGIWALVGQHILFASVNSVILGVFSPWRPSIFFSLKKIHAHISFGWKLLASNLVESLYNDVVSLAIGKKYTANMLAFYNRGKHFPKLFGGIVKDALSGVLLAAYSKEQDNVPAIKETMRKYVRIGGGFSWLMLSMLAASAKPLVELMLTEKWLPCVPYLKIACVFYAIVPLNTVPLQAVNAMGRSDIYLRLSITKRFFSLLMVFASVFMFDSVLAVAIVWACTGLLNLIINFNDIKKLFGYRLSELLQDVLPYVLFACVIYFIESGISYLGFPLLLLIGMQSVVGFVVYCLLMKLFYIQGFQDMVGFLNDLTKGRLKRIK